MFLKLSFVYSMSRGLLLKFENMPLGKEWDPFSTIPIVNMWVQCTSMCHSTEDVGPLSNLVGKSRPCLSVNKDDPRIDSHWRSNNPGAPEAHVPFTLGLASHFRVRRLCIYYVVAITKSPRSVSLDRPIKRKKEVFRASWEKSKTRKGRRDFSNFHRLDSFVVLRAIEPSRHRITPRRRTS